jgi:hypothetical protein
MDPLDLLTGPLRSLLGSVGRAENEVAEHSPLGETRELEAQLREAVAAVHRAAESLEAHVEAVEALGTALPPLTESVTRLTDQIAVLLTITAPLAEAERDVSRIEHLFGRRHGAESAAPAPPAGETEPKGP